MAHTRAWFPLAVVVAWGFAAGCEDDRGVVDIGAGGSELAQAGAQGSEAAGQAGVGGAAPANCPADLISADGESCFPLEYTICPYTGDDPCQMGQFLRCDGAHWVRKGVSPDGCGGAGGAAGMAGEGGAAGGGGAGVGGDSAAGSGGAGAP
jgi:hypothetical protein